MSAGVLLGIALAAILLLLFLVIRVQIPAFVAILLVSFATAIATGIPLGNVVSTMTDGMGKTLSSVMIVVGLGAMLGRVIEAAGGADILAVRFTAALGRTRVIAAVTAAAFILGIPVFFDVGFIILAPIVFGFARAAKVNPLRLGLPVAAVMLLVHVTMPPHPGPVAAAGITSADPGMMILIGLPICLVTAIIGFWAAKLLPVEKVTLGESPAERQEVLGTGPVVSTRTMGTRTRPLTATTVVLLIVAPIVQIMCGTVGNMVTEGESQAHAVLGLVGSSVSALLCAVIVAYLVVGHRMGWGLKKRGSVLDSALPDVAVIVFVTGAGGVFANVLVTSGIGDALSKSLISWDMPIILAGFLISAALRASQGSATVAILTTAGLLAQPIANAGYTDVQTTLVTIAIGMGALGFSHINDSGFWIVTKYLGLSIKDGLAYWTTLTTIFGVVGFALTWGVFALVS